jgi:hypothetical protein
MKGKLINKQTKEEHLCDKITIDGFDYYVSDVHAVSGDFALYAGHITKKLVDTEWTTGDKKIIATNNPNIDVPKVVELLDYETNKYSEITEEPQRIIGFALGYNKSQETHPFSEEDMIEFNEWCETSVEANLFWRRNRIDPKMSGSHHKIRKQKRKELLQLWKEQKPKIVYYEK